MIDIRIKTCPLASMYHMKQMCHEILVCHRHRAGCVYERYNNAELENSLISI